MPTPKDTITKSYMSNPVIFADAFNFFLYGGKQIIQPENLRELDSASIALPYGTDGIELPVQRFRDILKSCTIMEDGHAAYLLLGIENQSDIHYAMPVRNMLYDSLQYAAQVQKTAAYHRREKDGPPRHLRGIPLRLPSKRPSAPRRYLGGMLQLGALERSHEPP